MANSRAAHFVSLSAWTWLRTHCAHRIRLGQIRDGLSRQYSGLKLVRPYLATMSPTCAWSFKSSSTLRGGFGWGVREHGGLSNRSDPFPLQPSPFEESRIGCPCSLCSTPTINQKGMYRLCSSLPQHRSNRSPVQLRCLRPGYRSRAGGGKGLTLENRGSVKVEQDGPSLFRNLANGGPERRAGHRPRD